MKRIILCADGTWNLRDQVDKTTGKRRPTNVTKVARAVLPRSAAGIDQIIYYHDGLGTGGPVDRLTGGAFGRGIEENVRNLYRFIVYNYESNDELYFFGFSRGAFTVRTLAGFMNKIGLVEKDDDYYVPDLYRCYEKDWDEVSAEWAQAHRKIKNKRPCPQIKFVGVWDTVGALGAPGVLGQVFNRGKYAYHNIDLNERIQHAYQAIAIDERRKPFKPSLWEPPANWAGYLEQAWFPGVHSNIGGGYTPDGLANEALHWIVEKAEGLGLEFDGEYLGHFKPCFNSTLHDSMTLKYKMMGEYVRQIRSDPMRGEFVHQAAIDRLRYLDDYRPINIAPYVSGASEAVYAQTQRYLRGVPC